MEMNLLQGAGQSREGKGLRVECLTIFCTVHWTHIETLVCGCAPVIQCIKIPDISRHLANDQAAFLRWVRACMYGKGREGPHRNKLIKWPGEKCVKSTKNQWYCDSQGKVGGRLAVRHMLACRWRVSWRNQASIDRYRQKLNEWPATKEFGGGGGREGGMQTEYACRPGPVTGESAKRETSGWKILVKVCLQIVKTLHTHTHTVWPPLWEMCFSCSYYVLCVYDD